MSKQQTLNPWHYKPWWCQPWSILLTGTLLISSSWLLAKTPWLTLVVSVPILSWMAYFLLLWPQLIRQSAMLEPNQDAPPSGPDHSSSP